MFLLCARCEHPVNVAGDHVDLHIQLSARSELAESRLLRRVRDDVDRELSAVVRIEHLVDRQRHSVEADRALLGDCRGKRLADPDVDPGRGALGPDSNHFSDAVDVSSDDMAPEFVAHSQGTLEVQALAFAPHVLCGSGDRFRRDIDREPVIALVDDGKSAVVGFTSIAEDFVAPTWSAAGIVQRELGASRAFPPGSCCLGS